MSRKIFVGSLPLGIADGVLRTEFAKYGQVEEVFVKPGCEVGRQWAFVTFASAEQAAFARDACDRILTFPGSDRPCDVMPAKNQGMFGQGGEAGGGAGGGYGGLAGYQQAAAVAVGANGSGAIYKATSATPQSAQAKKIFVGSLPDDITEGALRAEFAKYGSIDEVHIKQGCEPGRQWAFVAFSSFEEAAHALEMTNHSLQFPGQVRPCEVTFARNQGMFGQEPLAGRPRPAIAPIPIAEYPAPATYLPAPAVAGSREGPKKIFVGSLPDGVQDVQLRAEFARYGQLVDVFVKPNCEPGRQWAFLTFASHEQALLAKSSTDRVLVFPGNDRPCEVTLARHQGMFGQDPIDDVSGQRSMAAMAGGGGGLPHAVAPLVGAQVPGPGPRTVYPSACPYYAPAAAAAAGAASSGPRKIFVGSLPDFVSDGLLRAEFSKYGQIVDVFIKPGCDPGRQWAFLTFATSEQAQHAKDATDRALVMPGAEHACEVMLAKNQGKFGQDSLTATGGVQQQPGLAPGEHQPPPPSMPPPPHLTTWRMYRTAAGLPYYHNSATQVTQWECPLELQVPGQTNVYEDPSSRAVLGGGVRYSPY